MFQVKSMETEKASAKFKAALVGAEKNGKSRLAATGRREILFHDFDNRAEALAGQPGVHVISYVDPVWPRQPEAAQDFLSNIDRLERSLDLSQFGFEVPQGTMVRTNVIDSIATCGKAFQRYSLYNSPDLRRELTIGPMKIQLPKSFDAWNAEMTGVENAVLRLLALPTDTIIILHEKAEEAEDSTEDNPKFTGRIAVYPARYKLLLKYFNEVWRVKLSQCIDGNNKMRYLPRVYPLPSYDFDAATALPLNAVEDPNITKLLERV